MTAPADPALIIDRILTLGDGMELPPADCSSVAYVTVMQIVTELTGSAESVRHPLPQWAHKWLYELTLASRAAFNEHHP